MRGMRGMRKTGGVRRAASLALAALTLCFGASIAGCRQMNEKVTIAVISDPPAVTEGRLEGVWNGVRTYAYANRVQCGYYESGKTDEERERTIRTAMNDRADVLVCVGEELADTVWSQQYHFGSKQFILFDGVPYSPVSGTRDVQRNTVCVLADGYEMGYLVGAIAAAEGYAVDVDGQEAWAEGCRDAALAFGGGETKRASLTVNEHGASLSDSEGEEIAFVSLDRQRIVETLLNARAAGNWPVHGQEQGGEIGKKVFVLGMSDVLAGQEGDYLLYTQDRLAAFTQETYERVSRLLGGGGTEQEV